MCRLIELFYDNQAAFIRQIPLLLPWAIREAFRSQTDEPLTLYLSKLGTILRGVELHTGIHEVAWPILFLSPECSLSRT